MAYSRLLVTASAAFGTGMFVWYLAKNGLFKKLEVERKKFGPYLLLYQNHVGPYKNVGPVLEKMNSMVKEHGLGVGRTCGFYFDDPGVTPVEQCRASVGVIVKEGAEIASTEDLQAAKAELENHTLVKDHGFKVGCFVESDCETLEFPFYGMVSIFLGVLRCYPMLRQAAKSCEVPGSLEIYDEGSHTMWIMLPIDGRRDMLPFPIKKAQQGS